MALNINWFPGHMKKTKEEIEKNLKLVDIVLEIIDARIPESSRNPMFDDILGTKPRLMIMNKADLADPVENQKWIRHFHDEGIEAILLNSKEKINTKRIYDHARVVLKDKFDKHKEKNIDNPLIRMMIVGIPNSGKSTFINNVSKKKGARVGNRPGVTQTKQWIRTDANIQLLDTPGVLWPKFDDRTGLHLSFTNAIKDEILNIEDLTLYFLDEMKNLYPENLVERYGIDPNAKAIEIYEAIAKKRGALIAGGDFDYTRTATIILNDFRTGKLGRITLEKI
ncbi:ribosome biogenesis GTPase YlqF [Anaerococcus sp. Marseille-P3915]|uniref:ribosome biogenesis GTPase YlqF n=1 Tax=Anaerococcus sp. Marseille-P3915 TaxID=2057799 RepID=UPI000D0B9EB0|nr:ribosome biogenesis GTPase YlqF [Anaerococcus sp. Marseille-P3915]